MRAHALGIMYLVLIGMTILSHLDSSKFRRFANDNIKFDENGRKFSKRVENTVGKGEIARYMQFLLLSKVFSKDFYCRNVKPELVWERVKQICCEIFSKLMDGEDL